MILYRYTDLHFPPCSLCFIYLNKIKTVFTCLMPSFTGAAQGDKIFAHVTVLPHLDLNTNSGWLCKESRTVAKRMGRKQDKARARLQKYEKAIIGGTAKECEEVSTTEMVDSGNSTNSQVNNDDDDYDVNDGVNDGYSKCGGKKQVEVDAKKVYQDYGDASDNHEDRKTTNNQSIGNEYPSTTTSDNRNSSGKESKSKSKGVIVLEEGEQARFIFHAAGHCGKLPSLLGVLQRHGIAVSSEWLTLSSSLSSSASNSDAVVATSQSDDSASSATSASASADASNANAFNVGGYVNKDDLNSNNRKSDSVNAVNGSSSGSCGSGSINNISTGNMRSFGDGGDGDGFDATSQLSSATATTIEGGDRGGGQGSDHGITFKLARAALGRKAVYNQHSIGE
jgi:hypothetical protein